LAWWSFVNLTSLTLLDRLKIAPPESSDWQRLQDVYMPLIRRWLGRIPDLGAEVDDLAQEVLVVLLREIPRFERQREGSFRAWLRQVAVNQVRTHRKKPWHRAIVGLDPADGFLDRLADPNSELAQEWNLDHDRFVFQKLLAVVQPDFEATTWRAFQKFAIDGQSAAQVAREMGLTENAVIQSKARILKRLRQEAGDLLE
jgi:RNA polymerase sigma-70 factor (ECF subfamily)